MAYYAHHNLVSLSCDQRKLPLVAAVRKNRRKVKICSVSLPSSPSLALPLRRDGRVGCTRPRTTSPGGGEPLQRGYAYVCVADREREREHANLPPI